MELVHDRQSKRAARQIAQAIGTEYPISSVNRLGFMIHLLRDDGLYPFLEEFAGLRPKPALNRMASISTPSAWKCTSAREEHRFKPDVAEGDQQPLPFDDGGWCPGCQIAPTDRVAMKR
jgi:hypothetical protein